MSLRETRGDSVVQLSELQFQLQSRYNPHRTGDRAFLVLPEIIAFVREKVVQKCGLTDLKTSKG